MAKSCIVILLCFPSFFPIVLILDSGYVTVRSRWYFEKMYGEIGCDTVLIIIARLHFFNSYKNVKIRGKSHIDFRTQCVIMKQHDLRTPTPYYMRHFQIFDKIHSFLKNLLNVPDSKKKVYYIFEEPLSLNIIVD